MKNCAFVTAIFIAATSLVTATAQTVDTLFTRGNNYALPGDYSTFFGNYRYARDNGLTAYGPEPHRVESTHLLHPLEILAGFPPVIPPNWLGQFNPSAPFDQQQGSSGYFMAGISSTTPTLYIHQFRISYDFLSGNGESMNIENMVPWGQRPDLSWIPAPDWNEPLFQIIFPVKFGFDFSEPSNQDPNQTIEDLRLAAIMNALFVTPIELQFTVEDYEGRFGPVQDTVTISSEVPEPSTWAAIIALGTIGLWTGRKALRSGS